MQSKREDLPNHWRAEIEREFIDRIALFSSREASVSLLSNGVASGIGLETARLHTCAVRSPCSNCCKKHEAASNAKVLILEKTPKARVDTIKLDISSLKFVRAFAD